MKLTNTKTQYGTIHQLLHWGIGLGIIALLLWGFFMGKVIKLVGVPNAFNWHKAAGITVLLLVAFRIFWRFMNTEPEMPAKMSGFQVFAARFAHFALYALMLVMPLAGWVMSNAAGYPVSLWGYVDMPTLALKDKALRHLAGEVHEWAGWALVVVISIHFLAALYHQFIQKDGLLWRMLPCSSACAVKAALSPEEKKLSEKAPWA